MARRRGDGVGVVLGIVGATAHRPRGPFRTAITEHTFTHPAEQPERHPHGHQTGLPFLWTGFRENFRVLKWITERLEGTAAATETPIGYVPTAEDLDLTGLDTDPADVTEALTVDPAEWREELGLIERWFATIGDKLPAPLTDELDALRHRLGASVTRSGRRP